MNLIAYGENTMRNVLYKIEPKKAEKSAHRKRKRTDEAHCVHYWVIETPRGPTSTGVCKYCGAEKEFKNYIVYSPWEDELAKSTDQSGTTDAEI